MSTMRLHSHKVDPLTLFIRLHTLLYSAALLALFYRHLTAPPLSSTSSLLLILADLTLAFMWALSLSFRWRPLSRQEHPDRLIHEAVDLLPLDIFICTADPWKEPPMTVVNTALSVMAYDYPPQKLSVYVSDDGGSDLTLFAFMEAAKFARHWLPYCRENGLDQRAPHAYFESCTKDIAGSEKMKIMYQKMKEKVDGAVVKGYVDSDLAINSEEYDIFQKWKGFTRQDHPSVVQVLAESSKDSDVAGNSMPNLIYVSREKRPNSAHHFKAGALNSLLRVSSIMTSAPVILLLDCDMCSNDPQTPQRALCYILDPVLAPELSYVQFPQHYQGLNKSDIYGGEIKRLFRINAQGMDGLRGPNFVGTGCFFVRRSLYGPPSSARGQFYLDLKDHGLTDHGSIRSEPVLKRACEATGCKFELGKKWGATIGFRYGSLVEDYFTGYLLHCEGWRSVLCDPERPAFLGDAPKNLNDTLSQCKRWVVGLYEVAFSKYNPLIFGVRKASPLTGMAYAFYAYWGCWCIPIAIYALLPQLALIYDVPLFPKLSDPWFYLYAYLFLAAYCVDIIEFLASGSTIQRWWSDQRIWLVRGLTAFVFATVQFAMNLIGLSAPGFNLTNKTTEDEQSERYDKGIFDFSTASPFYVPLGTAAIINLSSFVVGMLKAARTEEGLGEMFVQLFISTFAVANCWPVIEAMFVRRDGGKMPINVTVISILVAGLLCILGYFVLAQ